MNAKFVLRVISALLAILILFTGCSLASSAVDGKMNVIATTTIVGDVVRAVGGDLITVYVLIPANIDEHSYEPTAREIARASDAEIIFMNGAGLERFIEQMMINAAGKAKLVSVSDGIPLLNGPVEQDEHTGEASTGDPHVWTDPNNILVWVDQIEKALIEADPGGTAVYRKNAADYRQQIQDLDAWVKQQVDLVPADRRMLVTDHMVFTYFADRYGFEQVGAIVPGYSTASAPSAQELGALEDHIRKLKVPVIFVGNTVNQTLAARVAEDTGTRLVQIFTGSLTAPDGLAPTYIDYIHYNVNAIVSALK